MAGNYGGQRWEKMLQITRLTARLTSVFRLAEIGEATEGEVMVVDRQMKKRCDRTMSI